MTQFKVSYNYNTAIIQTSSHREAAEIYFNKFLHNEDSWIAVSEKGFRNRKNIMRYRTSALFPGLIKIPSGNENFDEKRLDSYSLKQFEFIKNHHPNWLQNIVISPNLPDYKVNEFTIRIPNEFQNYFPIEIEIYDGDGSIISFGYSWYDWYELRHVSGLSWSEWKHNEPKLFYKVVENIVNDIISEELISVNATRTKGLGLGSINGLFLTEEEYKLTMQQNTLLQAISWKGTYNYQKYD